MENQPLILAVDDEWTILKLISINLSESGYHVITASDGKSALALFEQYHPDLVLLDIMMPGMDGFELAQLIKERSNVPIIMVSASDDVANICRSLADSADDYVTKPFSVNVLSAKIQAKLRRCVKSDRSTN